MNSRSNQKQLVSGLTLLHKEIPCGMVEVRITIESGALFEPFIGVPEGTAHLLEHVVHEETRAFKSRNDLLESIHSTGGYRNATTSNHEKMDFHVMILSADAEAAFKYLSEIFMYSKMSNAALEKQREIVIQEYRQREKKREL